MPANPLESPGPKRISAGAIAGIVIGVLLGLAGLCVGAFLLWRKRRSTIGQETLMPDKSGLKNEVSAEKDGREVHTFSELATGTECHEAMGHHGVSEVEEQPRYELPDHSH